MEDFYEKSRGKEADLVGRDSVGGAGPKCVIAMLERQGLATLWPFLGPAFIAALAYIDPGNFATNIEGGRSFGCRLLW